MIRFGSTQRHYHPHLCVPLYPRLCGELREGCRSAMPFVLMRFPAAAKHGSFIEKRRDFFTNEGNFLCR